MSKTIVITNIFNMQSCKDSYGLIVNQLFVGSLDLKFINACFVNLGMEGKRKRSANSVFLVKTYVTWLNK